MRTIAHISDLHFGRLHEETLEPLKEKLRALAPDVIAVSGDLTQRARRSQFRAARVYLDELPKPQIVVPGNHDVPMYRVWSRVFWPLRNYRRFIDDDLCPFFRDDEIAVAGINTARSATTKHGRVNVAQVEEVARHFASAGDDVRKLVVTHHPFDLPAAARGRLVGRARMAMERLAEVGVDVFLAGHGHTTELVYTSTRYGIEGHSAIVLQAGTTTSTRTRDEPNSFNVVRLGPDEVEVVTLHFDTGTRTFQPVRTQRSQRSRLGWDAAA